MLFFGSEIEEHHQKYDGIHLHQFLGNILAFVKYAALILSQLRYAGSLRIEMRMDGMRGVRWVHFIHNFPENGPCSELDDTIQFSFDTTTDLLISAPDKIGLTLLRYVFFATNWLNEIGSPEEFGKYLLKQAYSFNGWGEPK